MKKSTSMEKLKKDNNDISVLVVAKLFGEHFDSLYYGRHLNQEEVHTILQAHAEGSSLRGISRISGRAYGTVVSLVRDASQKAQMMHNQEVQQIDTEEVLADVSEAPRKGQCGHLWKKTEKLPPRGVNDRRLLDWLEFSPR